MKLDLNSSVQILLCRLSQVNNTQTNQFYLPNVFEVFQQGFSHPLMQQRGHINHEENYTVKITVKV